MNRKIAPNRYAPNAARSGLHWAKITSPTAIQPRPLDGLVAEPAGLDGQRDRRAGQAGQQAADEHVGVARAVHVDALGVGGAPGSRRPRAGGGPGGSARSSTTPAARAGSRRTRGRSGRGRRSVRAAGPGTAPGREARAAATSRRRSTAPRRGPGRARAEERQGEARHDLVGAEVDRERRRGAGSGRRRPASRRRAPSHGLPVATTVENPATAPISIIPSTPRFRTPARSAKISPIAANSRIVPVATPAARTRLEVHQADRRPRRDARRSGRGSGPGCRPRSAQNRMMPWIIAGTPDGWISRPARISAPNRIEAMTTRNGRTSPGTRR